MNEKLLPIEAVMSAIGVKRTKLYTMIAQGEFPPPVKVGASSRWPESDVTSYQRSLVERRSLACGDVR